MSFASRLKEARLRMHLTQGELGNAIGCAKSTIAGYELGTSEPNIDLIARIMDTLHIDANYLWQDEMNVLHENTATMEEMEKLVLPYRSLDRFAKELLECVLAKEKERCHHSETVQAKNEPTNLIRLRLSEQPVSAGTGVYLGPEAFEEIWVQDTPKTCRASFAVRVSGDSMEPLYSNGDIILVSNEEVCEDDIAVVTLNGEGFVKKIGDGKLISLNSQYPPIPLNESVRVNGRVIGVLSPSHIWG